MTNKVTRTALVTERASDYANNANILAKDGSVNSAPGDKEVSGHKLQGNVAEPLDRAKAYVRVNHGTPVDDVFYFTWKVPYTNYCRTAAGVDCGEFSNAVANGADSTAVGWSGVGSPYSSIQNDGYLSNKCLRFQHTATGFGGNWVTMSDLFTTPANPSGGEVRIRVKRTTTIIDTVSIGGGYTELKLLVVASDGSTIVKTFTIFRHNVPSATIETDLGHTDWYNDLAELTFNIGDLSANTQYKLRFTWTKDNGSNPPGIIQQDTITRDMDFLRIHFPLGESQLTDTHWIEPFLDKGLVLDIRDAGAPSTGGSLVDRFYNIRDVHDPAMTGAGSVNTAWTDACIWDEGWDAPTNPGDPTGWVVTEPAGTIVEVLDGYLHLKAENTANQAQVTKDVGHLTRRGVTIEFHNRIEQHGVFVNPSGFVILVHDGATRNGIYLTPSLLSYSRGGITQNWPGGVSTDMGVAYVWRMVIKSDGGAAASTIILWRRREDETTWTYLGTVTDAGTLDATTADGTVSIRAWADADVGQVTEHTCKYFTIVRGRYITFTTLPSWTDLKRARVAVLRSVVATQDATTLDIDTMGFELKWTVPPVHPGRTVAEGAASRFVTRLRLEPLGLADAPMLRVPTRLRREELSFTFEALRFASRRRGESCNLAAHAARMPTRVSKETRSTFDAVEPRTFWRRSTAERTVIEDDRRDLTRFRQEQRSMSYEAVRRSTRNRREDLTTADAVEPRKIWRPSRETRTTGDSLERSLWRVVQHARSLTAQVLRTLTPLHVPSLALTATDTVEPRRLWRPALETRNTDDGDKRALTRIREETRVLAAQAARTFTPRYLPTLARTVLDIVGPRTHYRPAKESLTRADHLDSRVLQRARGSTRTALDDDRRTETRVRDEARTIALEPLLRTLHRTREQARPLIDTRDRVLHRLVATSRTLATQAQRGLTLGPRAAIRRVEDEDRRLHTRIAMASRGVSDTGATRTGHRTSGNSRALGDAATRSPHRFSLAARSLVAELGSRALFRPTPATRTLEALAQRALHRRPGPLAKGLADESSRSTYRPRSAGRTLDDEDRRTITKLRAETRALADQTHKALTRLRQQNHVHADELTLRKLHRRGEQTRSLLPSTSRNLTRHRLTDRTLRDEDRRTVYEIGQQARALAAELRRSPTTLAVASRGLSDAPTIRTTHRTRLERRSLEVQLLRALMSARAEARRLEEIVSARRTNVDWTTLIDRLDDVLYFYNLWATQLYGPSLIEFLDAIDVETR